MKSLIELQQYKKCIVTFLVGIVCTTLAFVFYVTDPVTLIVQQKLKLGPDSFILSLWKKPPIDVYIYIYIFNVTNPDAFLNGEDENLKLQEIGPYVYQEILENHNVTWNTNGTVSFMPKRTIVFQPDMSVGDPNDVYVTVPNIPMLGISSALHDSGFFVNYPFIQLANYLNSGPILNITVHDYLWGYDDSLVSLAGSVVPSYVNFQKFGLLDRMYDEGENVVNMNVQMSKDMIEERGRYLSIESINGNRGLSHWGYVQEEGNETRPENTKCNRIRGATEGTLFPTNLDPKAVFRVYRKAFCRPVPIVFVKELKQWGLPGYQYTLPDNFADPPEDNPENKCYCQKGECMKKGLMNLTPCYYNIPAAASLPHFLNADPSLSHRIEGLNPDPEKHATNIILQPGVGIPLYVHSRLQTNLIMKDTHYNAKTAPFNGLNVPLFWSDLVIHGISSYLLFLLYLVTYVLPITQMLLIIGLAITGVVCFCWALIRTLVIIQQEQQEAADRERRDSTDLRIPLGYGQYTAIRILPAFKKITSRTDLFI